MPSPPPPRTQRIFEKFLSAVRAKIEPQLLIHLVAHFIAGQVVHAFENVLDLLEMVAVFFLALDGRWIEGGVNFHLDDVTEIVLRIKFPLAQVA